MGLCAPNPHGSPPQAFGGRLWLAPDAPASVGFRSESGILRIPDSADTSGICRRSDAGFRRYLRHLWVSGRCSGICRGTAAGFRRPLLSGILSGILRGTDAGFRRPLVSGIFSWLNMPASFGFRHPLLSGILWGGQGGRCCRPQYIVVCRFYAVRRIVR